MLSSRETFWQSSQLLKCFFIQPKSAKIEFQDKWEETPMLIIFSLETKR